MYIVGICRLSNSVAELQGWPTSQVLLDVNTNGLEDTAASLSVCSMICAWVGGVSFRTLVLICHVTGLRVIQTEIFTV